MVYRKLMHGFGKRPLGMLGFVALLLIGLWQIVAAAPGDIERVSISTGGVQGDAYSGEADVSDDGRFVVFQSEASNLVPSDTNDSVDIFVRDRHTGETTRVSIDSNGIEGNGYSYEPSVSNNGRFVTFYSYASNLVPNDTNGSSDVFVHDRHTGVTERVSVDADGNEGNAHSYRPAISGNGRFVVFTSNATNLISGVVHSGGIYVHDRQTGLTTLVSVDSSGNPGSKPSGNATISDDGRFVAFRSVADNLVPSDTNDRYDAFLHDRLTGETIRVSVNSNGEEVDGESDEVVISGDGRFIAFWSDATNMLVGEVTSSTHVYVHDRVTGTTEIVSIDSMGTIKGLAFSPDISDDGRFVVFVSNNGNLVEGDTNSTHDIFVHDRETKMTVRVSVNASGVQAYDGSFGSAISGNGRFVVFDSVANSFVNNDSNEQGDVFIVEIPDPSIARCGLEGEYNVIYGTPQNDKLVGTEGNDIIIGYGGNDRIDGRGGDDCLVGGDGNDTLIGRDGNDTLYGDAGRDKLYGNDGDDELYGGDDKDRVDGNDGNDRMWGNDGDDTMVGHDGDDEMYGGAGRDNMRGDDGSDHLYGEDGDDRLYGRQGDDVLDGGDDNDQLDGSSGVDWCTTGEHLKSCELPDGT